MAMLEDLAPGEVVVYHQGLNLTDCSKSMRDWVRDLHARKKVWLFQRRLTPPIKFTGGPVDYIQGVGSFQYLAVGRS